MIEGANAKIITYNENSCSYPVLFTYHGEPLEVIQRQQIDFCVEGYNINAS